MSKPTLIWLRLDLRLADNPALDAAARRGGPVLPIYIWSPEEEGQWPPGGASKWWLHKSLAALQHRFQKLGSLLTIRRGAAAEVLQSLARETGADAVFWNRRYEPVLVARDSAVEAALSADGVQVRTFNSALLHEPWSVENASGRPFQVFTPFWKTCLSRLEAETPLPAPTSIAAPETWPASLALESLELLPAIDWATGFRPVWAPGEVGANASLRDFLMRTFREYGAQRNRPDLHGTSRLSPHLHFGEIGPRQILHALQEATSSRGRDYAEWRGSQFVTEVGWREFAHHLLHHFPHAPTEPLREEFNRFSWCRDEVAFKAWRTGRTGYPIVDAGMRELWGTGWMHNRVRMIVASFLVKDLRIPWQEGARWFWDTLVDADLANNTMGWQWTAGCGADAAPFFRIFNPVLQGRRFDPGGVYVRRWCPELEKLPIRWLHAPWEAPPDVLARAGVRLGHDYPDPLVSHATAREVALEAYRRASSK